MRLRLSTEKRKESIIQRGCDEQLKTNRAWPVRVITPVFINELRESARILS